MFVSKKIWLPLRLMIAVTLLATLLGIHADVGPGQNAYLPPDKGYNYPKPTVTFPTPSRPPRPPTLPPSRPPTRPPTRPPVRPPTRPPTYQPPVSTYTPSPTRPPFSSPPPSYGPPTSTPYRPPTSTPYRPPSLTPTRPGPTPTYRPSPTPTRPRPTPPYVGQPSDGHGVHDQAHEHHHHEPGMPFDFAYSVNDAEHGNDYSHNAISDGDVTRGEYRIVLPDGRTQVVKYTADWKNGFNAQVSFEGNPTYPQFQGAGSSQQGVGYKY